MSLRILLLCHSFNSLSQRLYAELRARGHTLSVELDIADSVTEEAVAQWQPDVVVASFMKRKIPEAVWSTRPCLVVHPGPPGDRGPSALDWAVLQAAPEWGVTVLQANEAFDAGPVRAHAVFGTRAATKVPLPTSTALVLRLFLRASSENSSPVSFSLLKGAGALPSPAIQSVV